MNKPIKERETTRKQRLLPLKEAAYYLGIGAQTIYNKISQGTFPVKPKRIGNRLYFDVRQLDEFVDSI